MLNVLEGGDVVREEGEEGGEGGVREGGRSMKGRVGLEGLGFNIDFLGWWRKGEG